MSHLLRRLQRLESSTTSALTIRTLHELADGRALVLSPADAASLQRLAALAANDDERSSS